MASNKSNAETIIIDSMSKETGLKIKNRQSANPYNGQKSMAGIRAAVKDLQLISLNISSIENPIKLHMMNKFGTANASFRIMALLLYKKLTLLLY